LIADTVKIPLIGSHVFGLGDKAHRNGARIGELHFAGAIGKQSVLVNVGYLVRSAPNDGSPVRFRAHQAN
jgi:hypothetical protein